MIYLTGATNNQIEPWLVAHGIGLMVQPGNGYAHPVDRYHTWAADNGCFADKWDEKRWSAWLAHLPVSGCLFAVAPDVYPDATASLQRGMEFAPEIRSLGLPVAVVAQDGAERLVWDWDTIDCLFLGGEQRVPGRDEWKESTEAERLVAEARNAGLWVHMGRVNTVRRLQRAEQMGVLSCDGTLVKHLLRTRSGERRNDRDRRVAAQMRSWGDALRSPPLPLRRWESPAHPQHRAVAMLTEEDA